MIELYNIYVDNLYQRHILNQTYQILYTCLHKIVEGNIQINKKRKLQSVQNSITSTQAILYFSTSYNLQIDSVERIIL